MPLGGGRFGGVMRRSATALTTVANLAVALAAVLSAGCGGSGPTPLVGSQLKFGVEMAQRGLWNEALFRFEQARREDPRNSSILNNLAISYEAVGRFDDALATYKSALEASPDNRRLRQNYSRFVEFYQSFRPKKPGETATAPAATPASGGRP